MPATGETLVTVERMVRVFYERALADEALGPIFREAIHDWNPHIAVVRDFWSDVLHGTKRYRGNAFAPHAKLRFEPEAFDRWLTIFEGAAADTLSRQDAEKAIRIARHMAESFKAGIFPFVGRDGRPSRTP